MLEMENKLACVALSLDTLLSPTAEEQEKSCVLLKKKKSVMCYKALSGKELQLSWQQ